MTPLKKIKDWIAEGKAGWHLAGGRSSLERGDYKEALKEFRKPSKQDQTTRKSSTTMQ